jgi:hypothetical protein
MINVVNELQVTADVDYNHPSMRMRHGHSKVMGVHVDVDAPLKEWKGVTMGDDGQVVKIDFSHRCHGGA